MKSNLQVKFLSYMTGRKKGEGFTLIELLVVIIIIGILSAIALPSFLNQANKAKQSEAKQYVASVNKGQQAYYTENSEFIKTEADVAKLGIGLATETKEYKYTFADGGDATALDSVTVSAKGAVDTSPLKNYGGMVSAISINTGAAGVTDVVTYSGVCEATVAGKAGTATITTIDAKGAATCPGGVVLGAD